MAYVHCHSCPWSQDDFWNKSYNPIRFFVQNELTHYIRPRFVCGDPEFVRHTKWTKRLRLTRTQRVMWAPKASGYCDVPTKSDRVVCINDEAPRMVTENLIFSWLLLGRSVCKWLRRIREQVWWTDNDWKAAIAANGGKWPPCPECGDHNLDID